MSFFCRQHFGRFLDHKYNPFFLNIQIFCHAILSNTNIASHNPLSLEQIPRSEKIQMVHNMVEFVDIFAIFPPFGQWILPIISIIKIPMEPAEQFGHGQIGFPVAVIDCRVDQNGLPGDVAKIVAAPQIAVQQAWRLFAPLQYRGDFQLQL